ncbi:hypothetical protein G6F32_017167 [Rhizopus arrhizus]|nr:hypothetical protein G6F32_017167 [Rhizopus arrhizus]
MSAASSSRLTPDTSSRASCALSLITSCASSEYSAERAAAPTWVVRPPRAPFRVTVPLLNALALSTLASREALLLSDEPAGVGVMLKVSPTFGAPSSTKLQPLALMVWPGV